MPSGMIVLAEDDDTLRKLYTHYLEVKGYTVASASNGVEAISLLRNITPKVIILDIMMPNMNGIDTCRQARRIVGDNVPIMFLTAVDNLEVLQKGIRAGGDDYVIKSESLERILSRVAFWMTATSRNDMQLRRAQVQKEVDGLVEAHEEEIQTQTQNVDDGAVETHEAPETHVDATRVEKVLSGTDPPGETDRAVQKMSQFIAVARSHAPEDFGSTAEQKLSLLGYTAGIVGYWSEHGKASNATFFAYLGAVLTESRVLMSSEISRMIGSLDELSADGTFKAAQIRGQHDCMEAKREGTGYAPMGLAKTATAGTTRFSFTSGRIEHRSN